MDKKDELIQKLDEYIMFIAKEGMGKYASYLYAHNITTPDEIVKQGEKYREEIKKLKEELGGSIN